jgi:hypothetical protein
MKSIVTGAVLAAAVLGFGTAALATDSAMSNTMGTMAMETLVCHPAAAGETPTAMTTAKTGIVCKALDPKPIIAMKKDIQAMPNGATMWQNVTSVFEYGR